MTTNDSNRNPGLVLSVIIAVYDDWIPLDRCLRSLSEQKDAPSFEAVIVDDGSKDPPPESIINWRSYFPLTVVQQLHSGIPTARNRGIQVSKGAVLVFVDADCQSASRLSFGACFGAGSLPATWLVSAPPDRGPLDTGRQG